MRRAFAPALFALALAIPAAAQGADTTSRGVTFQPPGTVAGFRMMGHEMLDEPGAGAHLRYERPGNPAWIDVYVYPVHADPGCTRGCDSLAVQRESDEFAGLIPELLRRGYYDSLRVDRDQAVSLGAPGAARYGRHLVLRGGREGQAVTSHFYLVSGGEVLVKVRATYPPDASLDGAVDEFARGFVDGALRSVNACAGGPAPSEGLSLTARVTASFEAARAQVRPALERLGYTVENDGDSWWTQPVYAWPDREGVGDDARQAPPRRAGDGAGAHRGRQDGAGDLVADALHGAGQRRPGHLGAAGGRHGGDDAVPRRAEAVRGPVELVWPAEAYLPGYVDALRRGWSADNSRREAAIAEDLEKIARDPAAFVRSLVDREAAGPPIPAPDGSFFPRLPSVRKWMWDGDFCGSISLRWQRGTSTLPPHVLGHVGYAVVPWKQGRGYATRALAMILGDARAEGLAYVEVTTNPDNLPSQRVILANGGVLVERFSKAPQYGGGEAIRYRIDL